MKLNAAQLLKVEETVGVEAVSEEHPAVHNLKEAFGDHTFFLDAAGLCIVELDSSPDSSSGNVVRVASWKNDKRAELLRQEPQVVLAIEDL